MFQTMRKWQHTKHSVHHFYVTCYHQIKRYSYLDFRLKATDIYNKYDLYSRTCSYGSSIIEGVDFIVLSSFYSSGPASVTL